MTRRRRFIARFVPSDNVLRSLTTNRVGVRASPRAHTATMFT